MRPELFELPFIHLTVKSYGMMMVIGFLFAVFLMRKMAAGLGENPDNITNIALYALITGVLGSRLFYVIHNFDQFKDNPLNVFAVWRGGLEFIGGVILAVVFLLVFLFVKKFSIRRYMDMLVVGLMLGLAFGRIGCFLNGCCFGRPAELPWCVQFPYGSPSFYSQVYPNQARERDVIQLELPAEYFGYMSENGDKWIEATEDNKFYAHLKPESMLSQQQHRQVTEGKYQSLHVHPTQFYSSANAVILCSFLYAFWRKFGKSKPGATFALMFILYGITRFVLETIRDDNPFEHAWWILYKGGTISQNIGIYMVLIGAFSLPVCWKNADKWPIKTRK